MMNTEMTTTKDSIAQQSKRHSIENMYPLSPMQEGLLFHTLLSPSGGAYVPQIVLTFTSQSGHEMDGQRLKQAWQDAVSRHSILRTAFYWEQREQPFQIVYHQSVISWEKIWIEQDWRSLSEKEQLAKLNILLVCNRTEPFELNKPGLMRLIWVKGGCDRYYLIWCYHHLILDGWSASRLLQEVFQQYFVLLGKLPPTPRPTGHAYGDYIAWIGKQDVNAAQAFWQTYFQAWEGPISLPILKTAVQPSEQAVQSSVKFSVQSSAQSSVQSSVQFAQQQRPLSPQATQKLKAFAKTHKITLNTVIQAALGLLLSRYCDTPDVVFGATCAGRPTELAGVLSMVGLFMNTLPVRVQTDPTVTVREWLQKLSAQQAATTGYEYISLRELQAWVNKGQSLFDCLLVFENYPASAEMFQGQTDLQLEHIQFDEWTHFPLTLLVSGVEQLTFTAKYRCDQLDAESINRLLGHLNNVITVLLKRPEEPLKNISVLCSAEKKQISAWNKTDVATYPLDQTLPDLFEAQVEKTPDAIALIFKTQTLTYEALNAKANQLAHHLQRKGIGAEQRVAVHLDRSLEMVIALFAILKTGAAYVPLDPSYPKDRLEYMLSDADVSAVLNNHILAGTGQSTTNPQRTLQPDNSAYVIYTSGSTGKPKGVINTHRGLVNRLCWMQQTYGLTTEQRVLHKTPLSFDVSVWEIFWPLLNGATLVIAEPNGHKDNAYLADLIQTQQISILHFVPSMLAAFLEIPKTNDFKALQHIICSGEALPKSLAQAFFQQFPHVSLYNLYGPTEAAIDVTFWHCQSQQALTSHPTVPIGRPIANTQIHLLDSHLHPVPIGIPGEIYIGGIGVARGYHNRPVLTAARFIEVNNITTEHIKESTGESTENYSLRLYKSGDLARYRADGTLEYLGRQDGQVKLRGVRIELGEIEAALCEHAAIRQAVVVLYQHFKDEMLVAYIVKEKAEKIRTEEIKAEAAKPISDLQKDLSDFLSAKLPTIMIPAHFVTLDSLPLTPNGKLNRSALPPLNQADRPAAVAPRTPTEQAIASIWSTVLDLEEISIDDNFFEIGGHSLSATRVNTRLRKHFNIELPLQSLFEYPNLEALATHIETHIEALKIYADSQQQHSGYKEIEL